MAYYSPQRRDCFLIAAVLQLLCSLYFVSFPAMGLMTAGGFSGHRLFPVAITGSHDEATFHRLNRTVDYRFIDDNLFFWPIQRFRTLVQVRLKQTPPDGSAPVFSSDLSSSSQLLLSRYDHLSVNEKSRFHQKVQAEAKASQPLLPAHCLHVLYVDEHICVTVKPSGILSVPGPRRNPSLAQLVYQQFPPQDDQMTLDQSVVHRLDMDTSGILVFARSRKALQQLQADFRPQDQDEGNSRKQQQQQQQAQPRRIHKIYHALVEGHVPFEQGEMDVALERDPLNPPFMRVAQPKPNFSRNNDDNNSSFMPKMISSSGNNENSYPSLPRKWLEQAPKPSWTEYQVLSREYLPSSSSSSSPPRPVTRLALTPHTGRTHQLRVHCAQVLQHAIVGDEIYGDSNYNEQQQQQENAEWTTPTAAKPQLVSTLINHGDGDRLKRDKRQSHVDESPNLTLCLHAFELRLYHPITGAPMIFQAKAPF